jgi:hypothetical protein
MRNLKINDDEIINLDTVVKICQVSDGDIRAYFADGMTKLFEEETAEAIWVIFSRESTDLRELVELRKKQAEPIDWETELNGRQAEKDLLVY